MTKINITEPIAARHIQEMGRRYLITSTVGTDLIPLAADGCWVIGILADGDGRIEHFLDFSSGYSCNALGYNQWHLLNAIQTQLDTGLWGFPTNDWYHWQPVKLAEQLCKLAPMRGEKKVFFSNSGAGAVEAAIKMCEARRYREDPRTNRFLFLSFLGAFHGRTKGALSLTASKPIHKEGFRTSQQVLNIPFPEKDNENAIKEFDDFFQQQAPIVANIKLANAIIIELVQGEGGINVIDRNSLEKLLEICRHNDIYVIVDEVQTGFYRTGRMFASSLFGVEPDIICLAKAAGGGFPLGATIAKKEFDLDFGQHSSTNGGNLVACAAGNALLKQLKKLDEYELEEKIDILEKFAPNGIGLMRSINLPTTEKRDEVVAKALKRGLILIGAGTTAIRLMPPLNISYEDLETGLRILSSVLEECV